jgi:DNA-binding IclR family transcriptional regulator
MAAMARTSKYEDHKAQVLELVIEAEDRHAKPPSIRALAEAVGVGVATMHSYLSRLSEEGAVEWTPKHHRSLRSIRQSSPVSP